MNINKASNNMQLGTAIEYKTSKYQGVTDKNNKHYGGPTGMGKYNLDSVYGLNRYETQVQKLIKESNNILNSPQYQKNAPNHRQEKSTSTVGPSTKNNERRDCSF